VASLAKYAAVLAALSVLAVLITPAQDELPCTAGHRLSLVPAFLATAMPVVAGPIRYHQVVAISDKFAGIVDVLSLTCTILC
jgi:hypothetical protein